MMWLTHSSFYLLISERELYLKDIRFIFSNDQFFPRDIIPLIL